MRTDFGGDDRASALALQPDGKIIAAGGSGTRFALVRYLPSGRPDRSFGNAGKVVTDVGATPGYWEHGANAVALQGGGKIVAAGAGKGKFALVRYRQAGTLDTSFGLGGKVLTDLSPVDWAGEYASAVAIQLDGKIVVAGGANGKQKCPACFGAFGLARYLSKGGLDRSFGTAGKVLTRIGLDDASAAGSVAVQPNGRVVAMGGASPRIGGFALARYLRNGHLDSAFGVRGTVWSNTGRDSYGAAGALTRDGRIVAAGAIVQWPSGVSRFALTSYTKQGRPDGRFGTKGTVLTSFGRGSAAADAIALQRDGKIVAVGRAGDGFAVARFGPDGGLDSGFGNGGKVLTRISGGKSAGASAVAIQRDGKIVVAGTSGGNFVLARYLPSGHLDPSFG